MTRASWLDRFAPADELDAPARARLEPLTPLRAPKGTTLFSPGSACLGFALVLSGEIRVSLVSRSGRGLTLYRVKAGETCIQTTLSLLGDAVYASEGTVKADAELVIVPRAAFRAMMGESEAFRAYVFGRFAARLDAVTRLLEQVAFARIDLRLARALLSLAGEADALSATHQWLADEIGTAREVVTRQLDAFARLGLIAQERGRIALRDRAGLSAIAQDDAPFAGEP